MGRPCKSNLLGPFTTGGGPNQLNVTSCFIPGDSAIGNAFFVKQIGTNSFVARNPTTGAQGVVRLQTTGTTALSGFAIVTVFPFTSAAASAATPTAIVGLVSAGTVTAPGTGYVAQSPITVSQAGSVGTQATLTISTKVVSATVAAAGTGGTNGTQTVTGTTGTGTKFTASVTVAANGISAVLSILTGGVYTANPTTIATEPVTGASLTGAQLNVVMGVNSVLTIATPGSYTTTAGAGVPLSSSTSGTGLQLATPTFGISSITTGGGGTGFGTSPPFVEVSGGGGSGTQYSATVGGGAITGYVSISAGGGYTSVPTVTATPSGPNEHLQKLMLNFLTTAEGNQYFWNQSAAQVYARGQANLSLN